MSEISVIITILLLLLLLLPNLLTYTFSFNHFYPKCSLSSSLPVDSFPIRVMIVELVLLRTSWLELEAATEEKNAAAFAHNDARRTFLRARDKSLLVWLLHSRETSYETTRCLLNDNGDDDDRRLLSL